MSMEEATLTRDTLSGGNATTEQTKDGSLIELVTNIQLIHLPQVSSSKSGQKCQMEEQSLPLKQWARTKEDSGSKITTQKTSDNGSLSMIEQRLSDPGLRDHWSSPTREVKVSRLESQLSLENGEKRMSRELAGTLETEEMLETTPRNAWMSMVELTLTDIISPGGTAMMV